MAKIANAIYAGSYGLKSFFEEKCRHRQKIDCETFDITTDGFRLNGHINKASFEMENNETFRFFEGSDGYPRYIIHRFSKITGTVYDYDLVGEWDLNGGLVINGDLTENTAPIDGADCSRSNSSFCPAKVKCVPDRVIVANAIPRKSNETARVCLNRGQAQALRAPDDFDMNKDNVRIPIIATLGGALIIVCVILFIVACWRRKKQNNNDQGEEWWNTEQGEAIVMAAVKDSSTSMTTDDSKSDLLKLFANSSISNHRLEMIAEIGRGQNGVVSKGLLDGDRLVAIKSLKSTNNNEMVNFLRECAVMSSFDHANVLPLIGFNVPEPNNLRIVFPYVSNGNLRSYLHQYGPNISVSQRHNFCLQVCHAMEYLASKNVIHRDLACRNILVDVLPYFTLLKLADFGLARELNEGDYYSTSDTNKPVPIRWWPPESLVGNQVFEERSDVWSFGIVCFEIFADGAKPYGTRRNDQVIEFIVNYRSYPERPDKCPLYTYREIMQKCWEYDRMKRPRFTELVTRLLALGECNWNSHQEANYENPSLRICSQIY